MGGCNFQDETLRFMGLLRLTLRVALGREAILGKVYGYMIPQMVLCSAVDVKSCRSRRRA